MKRMWIGIGILFLLLAAGVGLLIASRSFFSALTDSLEQASIHATVEDWNRALKKEEESRQQWEKYRRFWAAFTDHEPVEEMQNLFSQLEVYAQEGMETDFAAICKHIAHLAEAMDEFHNLHWWSVL